MRENHGEYDRKDKSNASLFKKAAQKVNNELSKVHTIDCGIVKPENLRMKWSRLVSGFKDFKKNAKTTGKGAMKKPRFYDEMHFLTDRPLHNSYYTKQTLAPVAVSNTGKCSP